MSNTIKITPSFLISLMSMARRHDSDELIAALNLDKTTMLTQGTLSKFAEEKTYVDRPQQRTREPEPEEVEAPKPTEVVAPEPVEVAEKPAMAFFSSGEEVIGFIQQFVDSKPNIYIEPTILIHLLSTYYEGVKDGEKISYEELTHDLLQSASDKEEVMLPTNFPDPRKQLEETQKALGFPVGEVSGPHPTEEELKNLPTRNE